jgi:hypothetical protein
MASSDSQRQMVVPEMSATIPRPNDLGGDARHVPA